jgi:prevent-host-death family protein
MLVVGIEQAQADLSSLIERVTAGEEAVVVDAGKPVAKIVAHEPLELRTPGMLAGQIEIADDFEELPSEFRDLVDDEAS